MMNSRKGMVVTRGVSVWLIGLVGMILMIMPRLVFADIGWNALVISDDFAGAADVFAIDLDGDGDNDVLAAAYTDDKVSWWENDGNHIPNFTEHVIADSFDQASSVYAIDLDDDGDIDVLGAGNTANEIAWWENDGSENFTKHSIATFNGANCVFAIDLDDDGDVDVLGAASGANQIAWWENDGSENFTKRVVGSFAGAKDIYAVDLDEDGDIDVVGASINAHDICWWENDGSENFTKHDIDTNLAGAFSVSALDLDVDGDVDVLAAGHIAGKICWYENDSLQNFTKHDIASNLNGARSAYASDIDDDGNIDVLGAGYGADDIAWWENDGLNPPDFTKRLIDGDFNGADDVYAADLDGDGDIDVLGAGFAAGEVVCWRSDKILYDAGPVSIDIPSLIPENTVINPQATVKNNGTYAASFDVSCIIDPGSYVASASVTNLAPGDSVQVTFPAGFTFVGGFYTVTVHTFFTDDQNPDNDVLEKVIEAATVDVGPLSIDIPSQVPEDTSLNPQATVKNMGSRTESFSVRCSIQPGGYLKTQTINDLAPGDSIQVTFTTTFTFESGVYTVTVFTMHASDANPANDTLEKVVETYPQGMADNGSTIPLSFSFGLQNNPAQGKALFNLALPHDGPITLRIFDISGRLVDDLSGRRTAGYHQIPWGAKANGIYFYTIEAAGHKETGKLVIIH